MEGKRRYRPRQGIRSFNRLIASRLTDRETFARNGGKKIFEKFVQLINLMGWNGKEWNSRTSKLRGRKYFGNEEENRRDKFTRMGKRWGKRWMMKFRVSRRVVWKKKGGGGRGEGRICEWRTHVRSAR